MWPRIAFFVTMLIVWVVTATAQESTPQNTNIAPPPPHRASTVPDLPEDCVPGGSCNYPAGGEVWSKWYCASYYDDACDISAPYQGVSCRWDEALTRCVPK